MALTIRQTASNNCSMHRGSTPKHSFKTNIDLTGATVYITYSQNGETVLEKTGADITFADKQISTRLSQEDTLRFVAGKKVEIQIRYVFADGQADASDILTVDVKRVLKDGVIDYEA